MNPKPHLTAIVPSQPIFHLTWVVSNLCNYRCSYCREDLWGGSHQNTNNVEEYKAALLELFRVYSGAGKEILHVFFSGGEPTYWKPLIEVCAFINAEAPKYFKSHILGINTNLSRPLSWWQEYGHFFDEITASYHVERAVPEKFIENVQFLGDKSSLLVRLMMMNSRFEEMKAVGELLKQRCDNFTLEYARLYTELSFSAEEAKYDEKHEVFMRENASYFSQFRKPMAKKVNYTPPLEGRFSDGTVRTIYTGEISARAENHFRGWTCFAGEAVTIAQDGAFFTATCGQGPYLGNLNKGEKLDFSKLLKPVKCNRELCHCGADIQIRKFFEPEAGAEFLCAQKN